MVIAWRGEGGGIVDCGLGCGVYFLQAGWESFRGENGGVGRVKFIYTHLSFPFRILKISSEKCCYFARNNN